MKRDPSGHPGKRHTILGELGVHYGLSLFFYFRPCPTACRILVPWLGIEPGSLAVRAWSPNHWTAREFPTLASLFQLEKPQAGALWVRCCVSLGQVMWAECSHSSHLLTWSFPVSVVQGLLQPHPGFWDFHNGVLSMDSCLLVFLWWGLKSGTAYATVLVTSLLHMLLNLSQRGDS